MARTGICHICGKIATRTCTLCGRLVCETDFDQKTGACKIHLAGRRAEAGDIARKG